MEEESEGDLEGAAWEAAELAEVALEVEPEAE